MSAHYHGKLDDLDVRTPARFVVATSALPDPADTTEVAAHLRWIAGEAETTGVLHLDKRDAAIYREYADLLDRAPAARADGAHDPARVVAWLDEAGEAADGEPTDDAWYLHAAARMLALERARAERAEAALGDLLKVGCALSDAVERITVQGDPLDRRALDEHRSAWDFAAPRARAALNAARTPAAPQAGGDDA